MRAMVDVGKQENAKRGRARFRWSSAHVRARLFDQSRVRGDEGESHASPRLAASSLSSLISTAVRKDGLLDIDTMDRHPRSRGVLQLLQVAYLKIDLEFLILL